MQGHIGISPDARTEIVATLIRLLADTTLLSHKTRSFHWNVEGMWFASLHELFQKQYVALDENLDALAERARALGGKAPARLNDLLSLANLADDGNASASAREMLASALADHEFMARQLRPAIAQCGAAGDEASADFLTGLLHQHEHTAWMLRVHLAD